MKLGRCPVCHARFSLDAVVQDEAGRELLGLLAGLDTDTGTALVMYLGLFRSSSRDLSNGRALVLAREALALGQAAAVGLAMRQTLDSLSGKQGRKPLTNHNYLKKVLADVQVDIPPEFRGGKGDKLDNPLQSKTAKALNAIEEFIHE